MTQTQQHFLAGLVEQAANWRNERANRPVQTEEAADEMAAITQAITTAVEDNASTQAVHNAHIQLFDAALKWRNYALGGRYAPSNAGERNAWAHAHAHARAAIGNAAQHYPNAAKAAYRQQALTEVLEAAEMWRDELQGDIAEYAETELERDEYMARGEQLGASIAMLDEGADTTNAIVGHDSDEQQNSAPLRSDGNEDQTFTTEVLCYDPELYMPGDVTVTLTPQDRDRIQQACDYVAANPLVSEIRLREIQCEWPETKHTEDSRINKVECTEIRLVFGMGELGTIEATALSRSSETSVHSEPLAVRSTRMGGFSTVAGE